MKTYCPHDPPAKSAEIIPLQRALKKAKLYHGELDGIFGAGTADAVKRAKYRLGYPIKNVDRCGGQTLLDYLDGNKPLPQSFKLRRWARGFGLSKEQRQRKELVRLMHQCIANTATIHYRQWRPMEDMYKPIPSPWYADCSEFVTRLCSLAGVPDPNGLGYNGLGNTDTLLNHCQIIPLSQAEPGDAIIFGLRPTHHTAFIMDNTNRLNPRLASHGSERGPLDISLADEVRAQMGRPWVAIRIVKEA